MVGKPFVLFISSVVNFIDWCDGDSLALSVVGDDVSVVLHYYLPLPPVIQPIETLSVQYQLDCARKNQTNR